MNVICEYNSVFVIFHGHAFPYIRLACVKSLLCSKEIKKNTLQSVHTENSVVRVDSIIVRKNKAKKEKSSSLVRILTNK